jgi:hypothetical protein
MRVCRALSVIAMLACVASARAASNGRDLSIGCLYPAGGRQGTTIEVMIGGQNLRGAANAYVSGGGVHASVTQYLPPLRREQLQELQRRLTEALKARRALPSGLRGGRNVRQKRPAGPAASIPARAATAGAKGPAAGATTPVSLPDHPMLRNLDQMSADELLAVAERFLKWRRLQQTPSAIAETVVVDLTIDRDAAPGDRELRLRTPAGVTNPLRFEVGTVPEFSEHEPNGPDAPATAAADLPAVFNGDIMPSDVDRFAFRARRGQKLVVAAQARQLMPYLADAVPGWFQAVLALYDADGNQVAYDDDYRFHPDPVVFYQVPQDGVYTVEIRDAIYRGREDFIYRIAVGEQPFVTGMFPLGGRIGDNTTAAIAGWNLPQQQVRLDTRPGSGFVRHAVWNWDTGLSNQLTYVVDTLPESNEVEPNDTVAHAQRIAPSAIVDGRIGRPGDVDKFEFRGHAGEEVVAEVYARRLDSPLDSLLRLTDASGRVVAWSDDHDDQSMGLLTHQADSYVRARLPRDGAYYAQLSDAQNHGGDEYAYRLRLGAPRPDFALCVTPSGINVPAGGIAALELHAFRRDGFDGEIEVALKDAPAGFKLIGGRIPRGRDSIQMTLLSPPGPLVRQPFILHMEGSARIGARSVTRPVLPADKMMQAFAYWHLVPAQEMFVATSRSSAATGTVELEVPGGGPLRIPAGGEVQVRVKTPPSPMIDKVELELSEPPKGVSLGAVTAVPGGLAFVVKADSQSQQVGYADNLIVEAFAEVEGAGANRKAPAQKRRVALGVLPAIPFEIVRP